MNESQVQTFTSDPERMRLFQQERLILEVTDRIAELMEEQNMPRKDLGDRLGKTKSYVTQLLDGRQNMTLRTIADVFLVLGKVVELQLRTVESTLRPPVSVSMEHDEANWNPQVWATARPYQSLNVVLDERNAA